MILVAHIIIALASLVYTGVLLISPSQAKLNVAYTLVAATIGSGSYLVLSKSTHLTQTCITGLVYLAIVSVGIVIARNKLANTIVK
jgi:hypothetical protein